MRNSIRAFLTMSPDERHVYQVGRSPLVLAVGLCLLSYVLTAVLHQEGKDARGVYVSTS